MDIELVTGSEKLDRGTLLFIVGMLHLISRKFYCDTLLFIVGMLNLSSSKFDCDTLLFVVGMLNLWLFKGSFTATQLLFVVEMSN